MKKTKITLWVEDGEPTRVGIATKKEFLMPDISGELKTLFKQDKQVAKEGKGNVVSKRETRAGGKG